MRSYIPNFSFYLCPGLASAITIHTEIICGEIGSVTCHYMLWALVAAEGERKGPGKGKEAFILWKY
jgi:hypothetical protein